MNQNCLVCNSRGPLAKTHIQDVFSHLNTLPSSRRLIDILAEILDKPLQQNSIHSKILCRKCYKACIDYDGYKAKMNVIKLEMDYDFTETLQKIPTVTVPIERPKGTIVVPASKLQPVPPDFQLNIGQLSGLTNIGQLTNLGQITNIGQMSSFKPVTVSRVNVTNKPAPLINLKVTIGSSVFTQSLKTSTVKISKPIETVDCGTVVSSSSEMNEWNVNVLPKEIFSTNEEASQNGDDDSIKNDVKENDENDEGAEKGDEDEMEIDEDCPLTVVPVSQNQEISFDLSSIKTEPSQVSDDTQYINVNLLPDGSNNYVLGNLKIYNQEGDDDDEPHTIVVDSENGSILEMMTGQKLVYENGELMVMQDDDGDENEVENDDEGQDSNDESQIELQVSGDEETANAIIAAAQEQGGAFIKVESGEMYRVKSVQSKPQDVFDVSAFVTKEGNQFRCVLCDKLETSEDVPGELMDAANMMRHLKLDHDAKIYICQLCGEGMRKRQDYTKHIADHSKSLAAQSGTPPKPRPHSCSVCRKHYSSRTLLLEHMNTHTGARPHKCRVCLKGFASKYTHQAHMKTHQVRPRPYKCEQCNKSFLSQQNLSQHERTHSGVKNFICGVCNKAFGTQHNLEIHGVVHSGARPHACGACGKCFARKAELADHERVHTGERPFECETCGARFAQRSNLHSHRRATHLDDKRHSCPDCPKRFKRRRLLEYHIKAVHTGERPLKCEVCHSRFVYPEHYKKHIRIHSGERPYYCEICGKSFNSRDNRNTHRFTHSDKKPYECLSCGQSYMRKRLLIAHMNASGHLAESIVVNQPRVTPRVTRVHSMPEATEIVQLDPSDIDQQLSQHSDDKITESIFHTSGKLELLSDEKNTSLETLDEDVPAKLFINSVNLDTGTAEDALIEAVNSTQIEGQLGTDENGAVLRLIQVKLPDGNDGWVALNE